MVKCRLQVFYNSESIVLQTSGFRIFIIFVNEMYHGDGCYFRNIVNVYEKCITGQAVENVFIFILKQYLTIIQIIII